MNDIASDPRLDLRLEELEFSTRILNVLHDFKIFTVRDLAAWSREDLLRLPYIGLRSLWEIEELMGSLQIGFGQDRK